LPRSYGYTSANGGVPWAEIVFQVVVAAVAEVTITSARSMPSTPA
jgi:hypothetical protein